MPRQSPPRPEQVVVIGNCQAEVIAAALGHPALGGRFAAHYQFVDLPPEALEKAQGQLARCTVMLVQEISNFADYPLRAAIPPATRIVRFPCLRFASLWPFDGQNGPDDKEARRRAVEAPLFTHFDGLLGRLRSQIPDPVARFEAYRSLAVDRVINFARIHELEERRLLALDRQFSCAIGQFVIDRFRTMRLFRATGHPGEALYRMLIRLVLDRLDVDCRYPDAAPVDGIEPDEVPVHPLVAKALGVTWADAAATYLFQGEPVCWGAYVRRYIDHFG